MPLLSVSVPLLTGLTLAMVAWSRKTFAFASNWPAVMMIGVFGGGHEGVVGRERRAQNDRRHVVDRHLCSAPDHTAFRSYHER